MGKASLPEVASADALVGIDERLRVVVWNRAAELLTGYAPAEALGRPCWQLVGGVDDLEERICRTECEIARRAFAGGEVPPAALRIRTTAGRRRVLLTTLAARCGDGRQLLVHVARPAVEAPQSPSTPTSNHQRRWREATARPTTRRQQEVLQLLAQGLSTTAIAAQLTLSPPTVRNHIAALLRAFGCHSRVELLGEARRLRLI